MMIITKKFTLRPFKNTDAKDIAQYINNKIIFNNTLHIPCPYTLKDAKEWLAKAIPQYRKNKPAQLHFAIEIRNEVVGCVSLMEIQGGHKAEIGYWLAQKYWKKNIMSEAVHEMMNFGFTELRLVRIYAYVFKKNIGSQKVLRGNGFKKEGTIRKSSVKAGKYMDELLFANVK